MVYDLDGRLLGEVTVEHLNRKFDQWRVDEKTEEKSIDQAHRRGTAGMHLLQKLSDHTRRRSHDRSLEAGEVSPDVQSLEQIPAGRSQSRPSLHDIFFAPPTAHRRLGELEVVSEDGGAGIPLTGSLAEIVEIPDDIEPSACEVRVGRFTMTDPTDVTDAVAHDGSATTTQPSMRDAPSLNDSDAAIPGCAPAGVTFLINPLGETAS